MIDRNYMVTDYIKYNIDECLNLSFLQNITGQTHTFKKH